MRFGTIKQHQTYLKRWEKYCQSNGLGKVEATVANGIDFLATLFSAGLGYSAINTARSALSSVMCCVRLLVVFTVGDKWKTIRLGKHLQLIELIAYNEDKTLCVESHLQTYLTHTQPLRGQHFKLLISYAKP
ncbi:hypothetical protein P5673_010816 [Acropora cervicornis]|uniref:Uncharacterized protein n=1 Tax=Acropora cervicornis TaxID=6130 RepID=A0AAD9QQS8_ACRCE|nr:hypothetical protein P5673_010816 [Acropora cervicornis]